MTRDSVAATWIVVGNTSLLLCEALTWSFGCTSIPEARVARVAITSLAFMFELVPDPVWNTSIGNWASCAPAATSSAAAAIAAARSSPSTPIRAFTRAAAPLTSPRARICARSMPRPEIGKFSTARCVWARHNASAGTRTSPMVSCSIRNPSSVSVCMPPVCPHGARLSSRPREGPQWIRCADGVKVMRSRPVPAARPLP